MLDSCHAQSHLHLGVLVNLHVIGGGGRRGGGGKEGEHLRGNLCLSRDARVRGREGSGAALADACALPRVREPDVVHLDLLPSDVLGERLGGGPGVAEWAGDGAGEIGALVGRGLLAPLARALEKLGLHEDPVPLLPPGVNLESHV